MEGAGVSRPGTDAGSRAREGEVRPWWPLFVVPPAAYVAIAAAELAGSTQIPDSVSVGGPFLLIPAFYILLRGAPLQFGTVDLGFFLSAASYAPFALWAALAAQGNEWFYRPLAVSVMAVPGVLFWTADTFFHVGAIDYFTKRVVQLEAERRFDASRALLLQWAVWCAGHVVEWMWLRLLIGDAGAAVFLGAAGLVTGFAYQRWHNALGLMVGHLLVNVAAALSAVALYGY